MRRKATNGGATTRGEGKTTVVPGVQRQRWDEGRGAERHSAEDQSEGRGSARQLWTRSLLALWAGVVLVVLVQGRM